MRDVADYNHKEDRKLTREELRLYVDAFSMALEGLFKGEIISEADKAGLAKEHGLDLDVVGPLCAEAAAEAMDEYRVLKGE